MVPIAFQMIETQRCNETKVGLNRDNTDAAEVLASHDVTAGLAAVVAYPRQAGIQQALDRALAVFTAHSAVA